MNRSEPSRAALVKICHECDVGIAWLVFGEGPMCPDEEVLSPFAWEQEKAEFEEKIRDYRHLQEHLKAEKQEIEARKREIERLKAHVFLGAQREMGAGKRENELLKGQVEAGKREVELLKEMKQLPPPPTAGGDLADMTMLGLAECGLAGW